METTDQDLRTARTRLTRHLVREAALADARLAGEEQETPASGECVVQSRSQLDELALPSDQRTSRYLVRRLGGRDELESDVLPQDLLMELAKALAGLYSELFDERAACSLVLVQSLRLAP